MTVILRAAFTFDEALRLSQKSKWLNYEWDECLPMKRINPSLNEQDIPGLGEFVKLEEEAHFGKTEAYATSMIEVGNRAHNFLALNSANEYVAAFPNSIKAYQLRAKIYRHLGREGETLADEQKAKELSGQE
jgi:hypothetical protein